jgi:RNA polymerase sigma factor (sigma-70 family)
MQNSANRVGEKIEADSFTDMLPTRTMLLQQALDKNDQNAWGELLEYYLPFVRKILLRMGLRGQDLEDASQEVYLRLWQGLERYRRDKSHARFRNWLSTLVRNTAINWIKKQRRARNEVGIDDELLAKLSPMDPKIEEMIEEEWRAYVVDIALDKLKTVFSPNAFEVLERSLRGEEPEQISQALGIRLESVYVLKSRVKARLSSEIAQLRANLEGEKEQS